MTDPPAAEPELEINLPPGVYLDHPASGGVRVQVRIPMVNRVILAVPRILLLSSATVLLLQAWRHHVYFAFWLFGLPFTRWLMGPRRLSLLIGERSLELEAGRWFGNAFVLPRSRIARIEVSRGNAFQLLQRAIEIRTTDEQSARLLVGVSAAQAEFVNGGLQRWLADG